MAEPHEHIIMRDGVVVVAVDDVGNVALVRHVLPLHGEVLSVPGGLIEAGEEPDTAANRELAEETGLRAAKWQRVGTFAPMPRSTQRLHIYEATGLTRGAPNLQDSEIAQGMTLEWWSLDKAISAVWEGQVLLSGSALALLAYAQRHGLS